MDLILKNKKFREYLMITLGCIIYSVAINYFYVANKLAEGGVAGISLMFHYIFGFKVGIVYFILNIPLIIVGFKFLGKDFIIKTVYAIGVVTLALDLTAGYGTQMEDILLGTLFGGVMSGLGLGLVFMSGGSTGGIDIIARIMTKYKGIPVGKALLLIDIVILVAVAILFGKIIFMYTLVALIINAKVIDTVEEGKHTAKGVTIISKKSEAIIHHILEDMGRGVTILSGTGAYTNNPQEVIYCILSKYEIFKLKNVVKEIDPEAFVIITDVSEVLGDGFSRLDEKM